eukprot:1614207-Pyramimonas_sp.AAC.1
MPSVDRAELDWHGRQRWDAENRLQIKSCKFATEMHDIFMRPNLTSPGEPCYFIHGAPWGNIPNILRIWPSCRADDAIERKGRQFVHACSYLLGDNKIQSGLRVDSEVLIMVSLKNLFRDNMAIWRSANDMIMSAGRNGRIPPTHIAQLIGVLPNDKC